MANIVGIDLGTTYSVIARLDEHGTPLVVSNKEGSHLTPSIVEFTGKNSSCVGSEAKKALLIAGKAKVKNFAFDAKRHIRTMDEKVWECYGKKYTATSVSALILKYLKESYNKQYGEIDAVVITVPANFKNEAREATMKAAKLAGLKVEHLIDEPTAAMFSYAFHSGKKLNGNYAIYDLGGGTFDVSIVRVKGKDFKILSKEGIADLGGRDFDKDLQTLIEKKFKKETGKKLEKGEININIEETKKTLSVKKKVDINLSVRGKGVADFQITRKEFEEVISGDVMQTQIQCELALDDCGLKNKDLKEEILVGGSTRIPYVEKTVSDIFGMNAVLCGNPDEAVGLGAAIYSAYKTDPKKLNASQKKSVSDVKIQEITPSAFGTSALLSSPLDKNQEVLLNSIIIEKGEPRPCSKMKKYYTMVDNQIELDLDVTEADDNDAIDLDWVHFLWKGTMKLPGGRPAGREVQVTFSFDENGIMHCSFEDMESGRKDEIDLDNNNSDNNSDNNSGSSGSAPIDIEQFKIE